MRSNSRRSNLLSILLTLCTVAVTSPAFADNKASDGDNDEAKCPPDKAGAPGAAGGPNSGRRHHGGFGGEGFGRMPLDFSMVNLSEDQKSKINTIRNRNVVRGKELKQQLMTKKGEMRDLMFSADATNEQILVKRNELKSLFEEAETLRMTDFLAMRSVLTPEQRKKWADSKPAENRPDGRPDKADRGGDKSSAGANR
jgi:Spy/CpxP family protein refolding chaperone